MSHLSKAISILKAGGTIAYPTEAVYGLGCDPLNSQAVHHLLALKQRPVEKGVILIASSWMQLIDYIVPLPEKILVPILSTWPDPVTWVLPAAEKTPVWIRGAHESVAVRVTAHPIAHALCEAFGGPLVSTSANIGGEPPAKTAEEVRGVFGDAVFVVEGDVGDGLRPTEIRDVTGRVLREG